jgi:hypothetical protein
VTLATLALALQVTWVRVEHAKLDIVGLVLGAFGLAGALVLTAFGLGALVGLSLILRNRRQQPWESQVRLSLDPALDVQVR